MHRVGGVVIYSQYPYANNKQFVSEGGGVSDIFLAPISEPARHLFYNTSNGMNSFSSSCLK